MRRGAVLRPPHVERALGALTELGRAGLVAGEGTTKPALGAVAMIFSEHEEREWQRDTAACGQRLRQAVGRDRVGWQPVAIDQAGRSHRTDYLEDDVYESRRSGLSYGTRRSISLGTQQGWELAWRRWGQGASLGTRGWPIRARRWFHGAPVLSCQGDTSSRGSRSWRRLGWGLVTSWAARRAT